MKSTVDIALGTAPEVYQLFSYANPSLALTDVISHGFNQSLQRDMFFGSWADAYIHDNGEYRVKLTSPSHDLSAYPKLVRNYLAAGRLALQTFNTKVLRGTGFQFLLPFGLAMANVRSVQLFHFPPNECFFYSDYLYSPTNRRWECLLAQNGFDGRDNTVVERIVDVVPIAAAGGAMKEIAPYNFDFLAYGKKQLKTFLATTNAITAPVVGYGGPVRDWLWKVYKKQITAQLGDSANNPLQVMSIIELEIVKGKTTPVLCANHPSMYLYDTDIPVNAAAPAKTSSAGNGDGDGDGDGNGDGNGNGNDNDNDNGDGNDYPAPLTVMRQDLIAAGWQAAMAKKWDADPKRTLNRMKKRWADDDAVKAIMVEQNTEFGYAK